ncbi:MAG TPA: MJ0042-type zinc finger domain-containing protein [Urbifossiella sp.]|nr:MJ0042-type zinc finger domain-containing protein [Urbifossiella sp.]
MPVTYTCPHCEAAIKAPNAVPAGRRVKCPKCEQGFVPVPEAEAAPKAEGGAGTFKFADDGGAKKKPSAGGFNFSADPKKKPAAKPAAKPKGDDGPKPTSSYAPPKAKPTVDEDDDEDAESIKRGYGVAQETDEEKMKAEQAKVKYGDVQDKYKKSAKGPAVGLLVMPANLMTAAGLIAAAAGLVFFVIGMWPLVFSDAPVGDEEFDEAIMTMFMGLLVFLWGGFICFGASHLSELGNYTFAIAGAVLAVPLLVGIYAVIMLQDPKVKEGFAETEGGPEDEDELDKDDDDEDEDDEDDDD